MFISASNVICCAVSRNSTCCSIPTGCEIKSDRIVSAVFATAAWKSSSAASSHGWTAVSRSLLVGNPQFVRPDVCTWSYCLQCVRHFEREVAEPLPHPSHGREKVSIGRTRAPRNGGSGGLLVVQNHDPVCRSCLSISQSSPAQLQGVS